MKNKTSIIKLFIFILLFIQTIFTFISIDSEGLLLGNLFLLISQFSTIVFNIIFFIILLYKNNKILNSIYHIGSIVNILFVLLWSSILFFSTTSMYPCGFGIFPLIILLITILIIILFILSLTNDYKMYKPITITPTKNLKENKTVEERLFELNNLLEKQLITNDDYIKMKNKILNEL